MKQVLVKMWNKWNIFISHQWEWKWYATLENSFSAYYKVKHMQIPWSSNFTPIYLSKRNKAHVHKKTCTKNVQRSQKHERIQMSTKRHLDKWATTLKYSHAMDRYWELKGTKWVNLKTSSWVERARHKECLLYDCTFMKFRISTLNLHR